MLYLNQLVVNVGNKTILNDLNLEIRPGSIHVLMGPNGAGKSTICKTILNHPDYQIISGNIVLDKEDITNKKTSEIAKKGIYLINQNPIEIEGITTAELYRTALKEREEYLDLLSYRKLCSESLEQVNLSKTFLHRNVNVGMSGGERKKNELFGMWMLKPKVILFDEIDSGLDVDALNTVADSILKYQKDYNAAILLITHQQKLIDKIKPDYIHVMKDGKIIQSGDITLAKKIDLLGFEEITGTMSCSKEDSYE